MSDKFTITDTVSNTDWGNVDKTRIRNMLVKGLEEKAEGIREAIREVYAIIRSENLEDAPSHRQSHLKRPSVKFTQFRPLSPAKCGSRMYRLRRGLIWRR